VFGVVGAMFVLAAVLLALRPFLPVFDGLTFTQGLVVCCSSASRCLRSRQRS